MSNLKGIINPTREYLNELTEKCSILYKELSNKINQLY